MSTLTTNPMILTAAGVISTTPIIIKKIVLYPGGAGKLATFYYWNAGVPEGVVDAATTTVSGTNTVTSTGNFTAALGTQYGVIKFGGNCLTSAGVASANINATRLIATVSSDDAITVLPATLTNEVAGVYSWKTYEPIAGPKLVSPGTETATEEIDYGDHWLALPNLILGIFDGSAVHLYV